MKAISQSILDTIGSTPLIQLNKVTKKDSSLQKHNFFSKVEYFNPGGSIKDRVARAMVEAAEKKGILKPGGTIVEATSGNTGIGLALVAAVKGYKCVFVLPEKMSQEKRDILKAYGARVVITPMVEPDHPMSHYSVAQKIADGIAKKTNNCFYVNQFNNLDNMDHHYMVTGPEIWEQTGGNIDVFVAGVGTGGTLSGIAKYLKEKKPSIKIICIDPVGSILYDLYYHGKVVEPPASYLVEGVGEDILPDNCKMDLYDGFIRVTDPEAFKLTRDLAVEEGLCVGPSSALILAGAMKFAAQLEKPANIVTVMPDSGRAYLSKAFNDQWMINNNFLDKEILKTVFNTEVLAAEEIKQYE